MCIRDRVNTVKGYAKHEESTFTQVVEARAKATQTQLNIDAVSYTHLDVYKRQQYDDPNSPTHRVGSDRANLFESVTHRFPMLSLANTYSEEEVVDFDARVRKEVGEAEYVCELKYDGTAISLLYEHGRLVRAATRGDGLMGDDVTENARTIRSIPLQLRGNGYPGLFEIRGEILICLLYTSRCV